MRQKAAVAVMYVCELNTDSFASVLNNIAGLRLDVYQQRGWEGNPLKEIVDQNRIKEATIILW